MFWGSIMLLSLNGVAQKSPIEARDEGRGRRRGGFGIATLRPFRGNESGATAIEMGFIAGPFLFGLLALFEVALTFLSNQSMQVAMDNVARQIRTGEVKAPGSTMTSKAGFINAVCKEAVLLYDCANALHVDIRTYPTFESINPPPPLDEDGDYKTDLQYDVGEASSIIVARTFYKRNPIAPVFTKSPARLSDGSLLLTSALVFQNEPYE